MWEVYQRKTETFRVWDTCVAREKADKLANKIVGPWASLPQYSRSVPVNSLKQITAAKMSGQDGFESVVQQRATATGSVHEHIHIKQFRGILQKQRSIMIKKYCSDMQNTYMHSLRAIL